MFKCIEMHQDLMKILYNVHRVMHHVYCKYEKNASNIFDKRKDFVPCSDLEKLFYHQSIALHQKNDVYDSFSILANP